MSLFVVALISVALGGVAGYFLRRLLVQKKMGGLEIAVRERMEKANEEAKQVILEAKDKAVSLLAAAEEGLKKEKSQLNRTQERLLQKEVGLDDRVKKLEAKEEKLLEQAEKMKAIKLELEAAQEREFARLEELSHLTRQQAQDELFKRMEQVHHQDLLESLRKLEQERSGEIEKRASELVATVIQRYSRPTVSEITTSIITLPSEEIKGRVIGKEGRNIKHFEKLTGVEVMIDETPDSIMLSCFDPVRREVARVALERLIQDGRIQPARIEEQIEEAKKIVSQAIKDAGERAVYEVGIIDFPAEIIHLIGRLKYRTSYGQNVLSHSIEVATIARMLAEELGMDADVAKKAGIAHDIGKAVDHEIEGDHMELGIKILQKYKVDEKVILAMRSHHEDYPIAIPEAYVVNAADAISGARPGARRDALEEYLKRLGDLERIANEFPGVEKSYAIQSGRELRVFVSPGQLDDYTAAQLARNIANRISQELKFPGEIRIVVIRETRAIEYAK